MEDYIGVIKALGFKFAPRFWAYCAGGILAIDQFDSLFSLLGVTFGGNARTTVGLPDLRGRASVGQFQAPGLSNNYIGLLYGRENTKLYYENLPAHDHAHTYTGADADGVSVSINVAKTHGIKQSPDLGDYIAMPSNDTGSAAEGKLYVPPAGATSAGTVMAGGVETTGAMGFNTMAFGLEATGGEQALTPIVQPGLVVNYCICIDGLYPTRS